MLTHPSITVRALSCSAIALTLACLGQAQAKREIKLEEKDRKIAVSYPEFPASSPTRKLANRVVAQTANQMAQAFKKEPTIPGKIISQDNDYTVSFNNPSLVSLYLKEVIDTGGAHPNTIIRALNFGIINGKPSQFRFKDALLPNTSPQKVALAVVLPLLNKAKAAKGGEPLTEFPEAALDSFVVTSSGLTWIFQPLTAGAYSEGTYNVKVPLSSLTNYLSRKGPLGPRLMSLTSQIDTKIKVEYRMRRLLLSGSKVQFSLLNRQGKAVQTTAKFPITTSGKQFLVNWNWSKLPLGQSFTVKVEVFESNRVSLVSKDGPKLSASGWLAPKAITVAPLR